jgi:hypothetical protein
MVAHQKKGKHLLRSRGVRESVRRVLRKNYSCLESMLLREVSSQIQGDIFETRLERTIPRVQLDCTLEAFPSLLLLSLA